MTRQADADQLVRLPAAQIARMIAGGQTSAEAVVRACLGRIQQREASVKAWVTVDPDLAIARARACDRESPRGLLHGVPIGVKDVIDTADLPTQMGSTFYAGYRPKVDAACVALARSAGAIVLGKTTTAEFAGSSPTVTRNPHALGHTPGGSSSGSAAAVADFMVPVAFGTQTGGSVLRPASFCGVIGFKPTFGRFNPAGVKPAAESFDTVGLIARSIDDVELTAAVLTRDDRPAIRQPVAPRVGLCRTHLWLAAQQETRDAIDAAARRAAQTGALVEEIAWPAAFEELPSARATINAYERAHGLAHEWQFAREQMTPQTRKVCEAGFQVSAAEYAKAQQIVRSCRVEATQLFERVDVLLTPCVAGEAPVGLDYAGDPRFQEIWTMLHLPALTLPTHRGPNGMPVGVQLVAPMEEERRLFDAGRWFLSVMA